MGSVPTIGSALVSMRRGRGRQTLAVWAPRPTTRPAHAAAHLIEPDFDAAFSGGLLFGRRDPTDPLVTRQRGEVGPKPFSNSIELDSLSEISWEFMNRAVCDLLSGHIPNVFVPPTLN
jgi:hypothetical protein